MYFWKNESMAFRIGSENAALTHGHIDAILSAGYFASFISNIIAGADIGAAAVSALKLLKQQKNSEQSASLIEKAVDLAVSGTTTVKAMKKISSGTSAEEATALAVYLALRFQDDFDGAILAATSFEGCRSSVAPMTGNALGAYLGVPAIPQRWINELELADLINHGADLLLERVDLEDL
jgi:ADP-ribosylglycohydrolase